MKAITLCLMLAACSAAPTTYRNLGWAKISVEEAAARCYAYIADKPAVNHYTCMKAAGWHEN